MGIIMRDFYCRDTVTVARELLGKYLVRMEDGQPLVGRVCETEAYVGRCDKACHAYHYKRTSRTETLFAPPGTAYIYLIYGMYHCLNFVTEPEGEPSAVLIRGIQPRHNFDIIAEKRFHCKWSELNGRQRAHITDGPGKLCQALSLTRAQNGLSLLGGALYVCDSLPQLGLPPFPGDERPLDIQVGKRIGIDYAQEAVDFPWRFWLNSN